MVNSVEAAISRLPKTKIEVAHSHNFKVGDYLLRVSSNKKITHYYVEDVVSKSSFKVRQVLSEGRLSDTTETILGKMIDDFQSNVVANLLTTRK